MNNLRRAIITSLILAPLFGYCQNIPCGNWYGSDEDRIAIQSAMFDGTSEDVYNAINQAKATRGIEVGCAQANYNPSPVTNFDKPSLAAVLEVWNQFTIPELSQFQIDCPQIGRAFPSIALTAFYAEDGNFIEDTEPMFEIARMVEAQQYSSRNVSNELLASSIGIYGYALLDSNEPCYLTGVAGESTSSICEQAPELCIEYDHGLFSGFTFGISDHKIVGDTSILDADDIIGDMGGAGFDMGWSGNLMIEAALRSNNEEDKIIFQQSAVLAGDWALKQPLVTNHNYTAKLIWLLANLYASTGEERFRLGLLDRIERNLAAGVLMDQNEDGFVDGIDNITFESLAEPSRTPGRMWDGHNALPWYHSMNAAAMVEAYVALRDMGESQSAVAIRPFVMAMLDNLAYEINNIGLPPSDGTGFTDIPYSLLLGVWKVSEFENLEKPEWEKALWAIWNHDVFDSFSSRSLNVPMYLLILSETPYTPWSERGEFQVLESTDTMLEPYVAPNPASGIFQIHSDQIIEQVKVYNMNGVVLFQSNVRETNPTIDLARIPDGSYIIQILSGDCLYKKLLIKQ